MMSNKNKDIKYWVGFSLVPEIGPARFGRLLKYFPNMQEAWNASYNELREARLNEKTAQEIVLERNKINLDQEMEKIEKHGLKILTIQDENYPKLLKEIYSPPVLMYYRGKLTDEADDFSLAIVGTRKLTNYGKQITPQITRQLTDNGIVIVSGLALGIDSMAHEACLEANGRTIAVLGSGLDKQSIYPSYNRNLADKIVDQGGLIMSEFPIGMEPLRHNFPQRNRIVSGLSRGVLVVEAPIKSGALITARYALDQNREVFAIPGKIYDINSIGPNNLIKMGAKLVISAEDILEALDLNLVKDFVETKKIVPDSKEEAYILKYLSNEPIHVDSLVRLTNLDTSVINSTLTLMEMKGRVRNLGSLMYVISN